MLVGFVPLVFGGICCLHLLCCRYYYNLFNSVGHCMLLVGGLGLFTHCLVCNLFRRLFVMICYCLCLPFLVCFVWVWLFSGCWLAGLCCLPVWFRVALRVLVCRFGFVVLFVWQFTARLGFGLVWVVVGVC